MKALSRKLCLIVGEPAYWCPGCKMLHTPVAAQGGHWAWDGDIERPTITPMLRHGDQCHYLLRDGDIQFMNSCAHELAGQTISLPDLPSSYQ